VVSSLSTSTPSFTMSIGPTVCIAGTCSFKRSWFRPWRAFLNW
jgi:hypothetical protein